MNHSGTPNTDFSAVVQASAAVTGTVRLERNGRVLVQGPFDFAPGAYSLNRLAINDFDGVRTDWKRR